MSEKRIIDAIYQAHEYGSLPSDDALILSTEVHDLVAAAKIALGVIVRSDLKGKEPRTAIAVLTAALAIDE